MWQKQASIFSSPVCYFGKQGEEISGHLLHLNTFQMSFSSLFLARDDLLTFNQ